MQNPKNTKNSINANQMIYGKVPPQAKELEEGVLGAMLIESDCVDDVLEIINNPECFYITAHQYVFQAMQEMYAKNQKIDLLTVTDHLRKIEKLDEIGGGYFLTKLTMNVVSSAHVEAHARIIMEKYAQRDIIKNCSQAVAEAYNDATDVFELIDRVSAYSTDITDKMIQKQYEHVGVPIDRMIQETIKKVDSPKKIFGISTGFKELDNITGGWQKSDLIIIAARPSVGKTAYALNILLGGVGLMAQDVDRHNSVALIDRLIETNEHQPVAFFTLEMSTEQLLQRIAANLCDLQLAAIRNGEMTKDELETFVRTCEAVKKLPIYFDDNPTLTSTILRAKARKMKKKHGIELIIVDYLQLMEGDAAYRGNREQEISKISRDLKKLAKDLNIPIIALSQMSRAVEGRSNNVPQLSDLRESGAIEQDADMVMFLYKPSDKEIKEKPFIINDRHATIKKHRAGKLADLVYDFKGGIQRFSREEVSILEISYTEVREAPRLKPIKAIESYNFSEPPLDSDNELPF